jgi:hypothetical protein
VNDQIKNNIKIQKTVQVIDKYIKKTRKFHTKHVFKTLQKYFVMQNLTSDISATESRVSTRWASSISVQSWPVLLYAATP